MKRHKRTWGSAIGLSILMLALVSCGGLDSIEVGNHDAHSGLGKKNLRLTVMNSCPDVLAELQAREIKRMEDEIDRSAEQMVEYCTHVDPYDPYRYGTPIGVTVDTSSYQPGTVQSYNSPPRTQTTGTNTTSAPTISSGR